MILTKTHGNYFHHPLNTPACLWLNVACFLQGKWKLQETVPTIGEGNGTHSSTLAWKIPWTEEPGGLQSMGSLGVGHDWVTSLSLFTFMHWKRKWQHTPVFLPRESQGAAVYGVAQSWRWLKRLSSSSSSSRPLISSKSILILPFVRFIPIFAINTL